MNGKSIRQEGRVGDPVSLSSKDTIEFGVDIPDDNGAILYKRVICKIVWAQEARTASADLAEFETLSNEDKLQAILKLVEVVFL